MSQPPAETGRTNGHNTSFLKTTYYSLVFVTATLILLGELNISEFLGLKFSGSWAGATMTLNILVSKSFIEHLFQYQNLSRRHKTVEIYDWKLTGYQSDFGEDEVVELHHSKSHQGIAIGICLASCLLFLVVLLLPLPRINGKEWGWLLITFPSVTALLLWRMRGKPYARVDADGVACFFSLFPMCREFATWYEVHSIELQTVYGIFGECESVSLVVKGDSPQPLLTIPLPIKSSEESDQFLDYTKTRLSEPTP